MGKFQITGMACLICLCLFGTNLSADEYYSYRDVNGVLHFTDNLYHVPENQRKKTNEFKKIQSEIKKQLPAAIENKKDHQEKFKTLEKEDQLKALNTEKKILEETYGSLMKNSQQLQEERKKVKTAEESAIYKQQLFKLNKEISSYEERRSAFDKKLKIYKKVNQEKAQN